MSDRYNVNYQEKSLLDLAYKGLYLMQAMGQFSKTNALRDDLSTRMNTLAGKLSFENPSEVNEGIMNSISSLAMDEDGNFRDKTVIKPFYEGISNYYDGISSLTNRRDKFDEGFFKANDLVLEAASKGKTGYYDSEAASKSLNEVQGNFLKNARLYDRRSAMDMQKRLKESQEIVNVLNHMQKIDMDKELAGVQADLKKYGGSVKIDGVNLNNIFQEAEANVSLGRYTDAAKSLSKLQLRDKMVDKRIKDAVGQAGLSDSMLQTSLASLKGLDDKELVGLYTDNVKVKDAFVGTSDMNQFANVGKWKQVFDQKDKILRKYLREQPDKDLREYSKLPASELYNADTIADIEEQTTGGGYLDFDRRSYGDDSSNVSEVIKNYMNYMIGLNSQISDLFGTENNLLGTTNPLGQMSFLNDKRLNLTLPD
tara:strand:+ start:45 stop:1319 length:1275 start_codon:yes stop_codon:yes gene_type:complete